MTDIVHLSDSVKLLIGDCRESLRSLPDGSVHLAVTSPPYWGLRDYGTAKWEGGDPACDHEAKRRDRDAKSSPGVGNAGKQLRDGAPSVQWVCSKCGARRIDSQIGLERTPEAYVAEMVAVFREVKRVLREDGTLWLNLGDSYASQGGGKNGGYDGGILASDGREDEAGTRCRNRVAGTSGLKPKDLVGIPWRVAFALQADGWYLRQDIIWSKPNPMPESVTDRCTKAHEYIFLLTKSARYYYDAEAIKENIGQTSTRKATPNERLMARTAAGSALCASTTDKRGFGRDITTNGRNRRSVWTIATHPLPEAHFATFPPKLIEPCILAGTSERGCCPKCGAPWTRVAEKEWVKYPNGLGNGTRTKDLTQHRRGETSSFRTGGGNVSRTVGWRPGCSCGGDPVPCTILDCFSGAGTTGLVAIRHGRRYIGCELNPDYIEMTRKRLSPELAQGRMPFES